jgi:branched-chain amino acid transport system ATP-binding protein
MTATTAAAPPAQTDSDPGTGASARAGASGRAHRLFGPQREFALSLRGVGRWFGALVALADIDLDVRQGGRHAILGANGAGKTTLFNCITGDFPPSAGHIRLFDEDVTDRPAHARVRMGLRRTYQTSKLFKGLSVRDNLFLAQQGVHEGRFSPRRVRRGHAFVARGRELAAYVGLDHRFDDLVATLAHGEQRQLEIAMALAGHPRLILFDEPAAGLSPGERDVLTQILHDLPREITFVIIEHDLEVALKVAETVTVLHNGRWFAEGTPDEIERDPRIQAIYLGEGHG